MKKFRELTRKIGFKIAVAVSLMCLGLLGLLYVVVIEKSQESFITVVRTITFNRSSGTIYFRNYPEEIQPVPPDLLHFDPGGKELPKPLHEVFRETLQSSLLWVSGLAVALSFIIGFLTSRIFNRPLERLTHGMNNLRQNKYQSSLEKTGTKEFDTVIDEFNRLAQELQRIETLRKDLISDTSHELKTPLTSLMGQLEAIQDGILQADKEHVSVLLEQVKRLSDMVERLQEFSRLRNKKRELSFSEMNVKTLVENVVKGEKGKLKEAHMDVDITIPETYTVSADKAMLQQVFTNLFDNALAYSKGTKITVSAHDTQIMFADDGIGVPEKHLPYIFERFYRVEKSRNRATGGLGLGLAIVSEIIDAHGWKIKASNDNGLKIAITTA